METNAGAWQGPCSKRPMSGFVCIIATFCASRSNSHVKEVTGGSHGTSVPARQGVPDPMPVTTSRGRPVRGSHRSAGSSRSAFQTMGGGYSMKKFIYLGLLALGVVLMVAPPVMAQEEKPFTIHGEVRYRGEYDNNANDLNNNAHDSVQFWPYRVRIAAEGHFSKNVSAWIEFQNSGFAGGDSPFRTGGVRVAGQGVELYQGNV